MAQKKEYRGGARTRRKKELMIEALFRTLGNVSLSCEEAGIGRVTHYEWLKKDEIYEQAVAEVPERAKDFVENELFRQIKNGNTAATLFFLKTKAKDRGYVERQEVDKTGSQPDKVQIEVIDPNERDDTEGSND